MKTLLRDTSVKSFPRLVGLLVAILMLSSIGKQVTNAPLYAQTLTPPTFNMVFSQSTIGPGSVSTLTYTISNGNGTPVSSLAFTNTLPVGVVIASPASATTTCVGGILVAPDGGGSISFNDGGVSGSSSCATTLNVTSSTVGAHLNTTGNLTSSAGASGTASGTLTVSTARPGFTKSFTPSSIPQGGRSTLTFTVDNSANGSGIANLSFTDNLPLGMIVASPSNASTDCGTVNAPPVLTADAGTTQIGLSINGFNANGFRALETGATCTAIVDVIATGAGQLENSTADLTVEFSASGKAGAVLTSTISPIHLQKSFTDDPTPPGDTVTLQFTITNFDRDLQATDIAFVDNLNTALTGLTFSSLLSNDCGGAVGGMGTGTFSFTGGSLNPGASCSINAGLLIPLGATPGSYINTTETISGSIDSTLVSGNMASDTLFVEPVPRLSKSFTNDPIGAGESVNLSFTVTNTSQTSAATNITFIDDLSTFLPTPLSVALPPTPNPPCGAGSSLSVVSVGFGQGLRLTNGSLAAAPGLSSTCTFSVSISIPSGFPAGNYTNATQDFSATVDGATRIGEPATDILTVVAAPTLRKEFTDDPVLPGSSVTLSFTLSHAASAPADAINIGFTDNLNAALAGLAVSGALPTTPCGAGSTLTGSTSLTISGGTLLPGATCTFSVTLAVPANAAYGDHVNTTSSVTATVSGITVTGNPANDTLKIAGMVFSKAFTDDPVMPGATATLQFTITNLSATDSATGLTFTDNLAANLTGLASTSGTLSEPCGTGSQIAGTTSLSFSGGNLPVSTSCTFSVTLLVPSSSADGTYNNVTSNLIGSLGGSGTVVDPATDKLTLDSDFLTLSKEFTDDPVKPGGSVTLRFRITNTHSTLAASSIAFTDDLSAALSGLTAVGLPVAGCGGTATGTTTISFGGGSLAAGATCAFDVTLSVPASVPLGTTPTNTISGITGQIGGLTVNGGLAKDKLLIYSLALTKTLASPSTATATTVLTFTIKNNDSVNTATDLSFSDNLSATIFGLTATGLPANNVCGLGSILSGTTFLAFTAGSLEPSASCTFSVTLQVPVSAVSGTYTNTTSTLKRGGIIDGAAAAAVLRIEPTPSFSKIFTPNRINAGEVSALTFTINNSASALAASNLSFADTLPTNLVVASPNGTSTNCSGGTINAVATSDLIAFNGGSVAAGASCTISVNVTSSAAGVYTNTTGTLTSTSGHSTPASAALTVDASANLSVLKLDLPDPVIAGNTLIYVLTVGNSGPSAATGVVLSDSLPSGIAFVSSSGCAEDPNANSTCTLGSLAVDSSKQVTITTTVALATSGLVSNAATIASSTHDPDVTNNAASVSTTVLSLDFGDAPASYPSLLTSDGARHQKGTLFLGATVDNEANGQVSANADGDDSNGVDDEDGVVFTSAFVINVAARIDVTASGAGKLDGWIDYNQDGDWNDANEQIFANVSIVAGINGLTIPVPGTALSGITFARFRLSSAGGLAVTGLATDGEVEDYQVAILDTQFVINDVSRNEGNSGDTAFSFSVSRTNNSSAASVDVQTANGTATAGSDFTALNATTVSFANGGSLTQTVTVNVTGDTVVEGNETFSVLLSNGVNGLIVDNQGLGTITNDDTATVTLVGGTAKAEGNSGTVTHTFTATLSNAVDGGFSLAYATNDGTASTADSDYTDNDGSLAFSGTAGEVKPFTVAVNGDTKVEADETFSTGLGAFSGTTLGGSLTIAGTPQNATITNDDTATIRIDDVTVDEGDGVATFVVTQNAVSDFTTTALYTTSDGTANAGSDYTAANGTASILPGSVSATFTVPLIDDAIDEPDETYTVTLSSPANATISDGSAIGTIIDNDATPTINFNATSYSVGEGDGTATITVVLSAVSGLEIAVDYATSDGTAFAGSDYTHVSDRLTIPAGETSGTFTVSIIDDTIDEFDETVNLLLSNPSAFRLGNANTAILTITDNDATPALSIGDVTVDEGAGTASFTITQTAGSGLGVTVNYSTADGTASAGSDYTATSGTATILPGTTSATFTVPITDDTIVELDETFTVTLSSAVNATVVGGTGIGTITDNDALELTVNFPSGAPGSFFTFTAEGFPPSATATISINGLQVAMSQTDANGNLTFALNTSALPPGTYTVRVDVNPTAEIVFTLDPNAPVRPKEGNAPVFDVPKTVVPTVSFSNATYGVIENAGSAAVTVTLSAAHIQNVMVAYSTSDQSAMAGSDYTATSGSLTIPAGETNRAFSVPIINNTVPEADETIGLMLSSSTNATLGVLTPAILTIWDDDRTIYWPLILKR